MIDNHLLDYINSKLSIVKELVEKAELLGFPDWNDNYNKIDQLIYNTISMNVIEAKWRLDDMKRAMEKAIKYKDVKIIDAE